LQNRAFKGEIFWSCMPFPPDEGQGLQFKWTKEESCNLKERVRRITNSQGKVRRFAILEGRIRRSASGAALRSIASWKDQQAIGNLEGQRRRSATSEQRITSIAIWKMKNRKFGRTSKKGRSLEGRTRSDATLKCTMICNLSSALMHRSTHLHQTLPIHGEVACFPLRTTFATHPRWNQYAHFDQSLVTG
jgi:hypothetical protein